MTEIVKGTKLGLLRKPEWLKISLSSTANYTDTSSTIHGAGLHTICASGKCPNMAECWSRGTATFMIGGNYCTRSCRFCATQSMKNPPALDPQEPRRVAESVRSMGLRYAVITSVDRDDLPDGGAEHWSECIRQIRLLSPRTTIEVLIPDFQGSTEALDTVLSAQPDVVGHNLETVRRLTSEVRHRATYDQSLEVLRYISDAGFVAKTGIMVGLGEEPDEVEQLFHDCIAVGVSTITIGQYLRPTMKHIAVKEYVTPMQFKAYKEKGKILGLAHVESGPLVRSSYRADQQFEVAKEHINLKELLGKKNLENQEK